MIQNLGAGEGTKDLKKANTEIQDATIVDEAIRKKFTIRFWKSDGTKIQGAFCDVWKLYGKDYPAYQDIDLTKGVYILVDFGTAKCTIVFGYATGSVNAWAVLLADEETWNKNA